MKWLFVFFLIGYMVVFDTHSQAIFPPPEYVRKPVVQAVFTTHVININGKLDEESWKECMGVRYFIQSSPVQGKAATYDTEVKILYDHQNIYIGARCMNPKNKILVQDLRRDFLYGNNELFGVFFDPFQDTQNPVPSFLVTPYGTQRDLLIYDDRIYDLNWDAVWDAQSFITDSSWSTEIAIPWGTIRYPPDSTTWGINFNRNVRSLNEITGWSPWPFAYTVGRMSYAGLVTGLHPPKAKANLRIQPYTLLNAAKERHDRTDLNPEIGGEIKWLLNTNASLEGTWNTDFAQVEADRQVINLKRSSVFFPEKRQFFLENANLFSIGQDEIIQPFFSRRIGLDNDGHPVAINAGLRFIHQSSQNAAGAMILRQTDNDTSTHSYFGLLRMQKNIGSKGRIGAMGIYRYDESNRLFNSVLAVDGYWHLTEPLYIRSMASVSRTKGIDRNGGAFFNELGYIKNNVSLYVYETVVTKSYQSKTGYLGRTDFINSRPELYFNFPVNGPMGLKGFYAPYAKADVFHTASDKGWEEINLNITPFQFTGQDGTVFSFSFLPSWQSLKTGFQPVSHISISEGTYHYTRLGFNISTNPSAPYSVLIDYNRGGFYEGRLNSYSVTTRAVPIPHIAFAVSSTYNEFFNFESRSKVKKNYLIIPEVRLSVTPKIQLFSFYQYNTESNLGGLNLRFSWEYKPLSFVYLVFNNVKTIRNRASANPVNDQTGIIKVSYIKQI